MNRTSCSGNPNVCGRCLYLSACVETGEKSSEEEPA